MPWCPKCRYEYKEGYTMCADCNVALVDELPPEEKENDLNIIEEEASGILVEDIETLDNEIAVGIDEDSLSLDSESFGGDLAQVVEKVEPAEPFVKASVRAENYKSSAFALLIVGIIGFVFLALAYLKIIPLNLAPNINVIFYVVMALMFVIFIVIGIKSLSAAKVIAAMSKDEDDLTERIYAYFENGFTGDSLDELAFQTEAIPSSEEEKFFPRSKAIRNAIIEKFGELNDSFLTEMTENIYSKIYE